MNTIFSNISDRQICKARPSSKRFVIYRTPCGRRLRSLQDTDRYLQVTDSQMSIDLFCFDQQMHVNTEFVPLIPIKVSQSQVLSFVVFTSYSLEECRHVFHGLDSRY